MKTICALLIAVLLLSCEKRHAQSGAVVTTEKKASATKAEMLRAEIDMAAGELSIEGGGKDEVAAVFHTGAEDPVPNFKFDNTSFRARLVIDQRKSDSLTGENRWELSLPNNLSTDLFVNMGAGEAKLRLGSLDLRNVSLSIGAGKVSADFLGIPKRDYDVKIRGGIGECEVILPREVGIRAEARGGIGSIDVQGLERRNGAYENSEFQNAKVKIRLDVQGGIGEIRIRTR
ncbi:LiaF domain-containing protein [Bryobacter aggregatus]|uniref:LiaF domain-containing protein n=1 Tax=Bryobacter aggregatus TaxID=360054 RepID=UPI0004E10F69|nr:LiaF domain-containing protein [Bryobacter aggregatus]